MTVVGFAVGMGVGGIVGGAVGIGVGLTVGTAVGVGVAFGVQFSLLAPTCIVTGALHVMVTVWADATATIPANTATGKPPDFKKNFMLDTPRL
jgi:hypothetical protein